MKIREFYTIFSSTDESGFLFAVLKKLSLLEEVASVALGDMAWVGWPPDPEPDPGTPLGPPPLRA